MKTTYKNFSISSVAHLGEKVSSWDCLNSNYHKITVKNLDNGKKTSFDFWCSRAEPTFKTENDLLNVFYCFLSDVDAGTYSLNEFYKEFCPDSDIEKIINTWKECKKAYNKFYNLTGYSLDMLIDLINDLCEIAG